MEGKIAHEEHFQRRTYFVWTVSVTSGEELNNGNDEGSRDLRGWWPRSTQA